MLNIVELGYEEIALDNEDFSPYTMESFCHEPENLPDKCPNELEEYKLVPAKSLGKGWMWKQWNDGSGHLQGPAGEHRFGYDLSPYNGAGVEYQEPDTDDYTVFWGSFDEFMGYAESRISDGLRCPA